MNTLRKIALGLVALALVPGTAQASDWIVTGKVTAVEATTMPSSMLFALDTAGGNCGAGTLLSWNLQGPDTATQTHNIEAAFALLMTAKSTGQSVRLFGNNNCTIDRLYLVQ